jgi:hypothetical protein
MIRKEVIQLLGPSDDGNTKGDAFGYWLGPERGFIRINLETLAIEFDAKNRVRKAYIWRD